MTIEVWAAELERDGYCVIPNIISPAECQRFRELYFDVYVTRRAEVSIGQGVGLIQGGLNYAPRMADHLVDERVVAVCERLLRSPLRSSFTTAIINDAGATAGPLHADWPFDHSHVAHIRTPYSSELCAHITSLWSLSSPDPRLGGTYVIPGSHRSTTNPTASDWQEGMRDRFMDGVTVLGEEGSVLLLDSRLWHARLENRADHPRILFATGYVPWWLNIDALRPGATTIAGLEAGPSKKDYRVPFVRQDTYAALSPRAKQFFAHWVATD